MMGFWREMRRRHVFRIAGVYVAVAWVFIEILANVLPMFEAPDWIAKTVTLLLVLGFPIALIIAWAFEVTPDGIVRASDLEDRGDPLPPALPDYLILTALLVVIGMSAMDQRDTSSSTEAKQPNDKVTSLAVLPFVDFSEGAQNQYLGNGIAESVMNALARAGGVSVASRTSSFANQNRDLDVKSIGEKLGVTHILEGSIRRQDQKLRVSAQLTDVASGYQIWAETYDQQFSDIFSIEENLTQALVVALSIPLALNDGPIAKAGTDNVEAYNLSLEGRYLFRAPTQANFTRALLSFKRAIELDPDFWSAHGYLAYCLGYASIYTSYSEQVVDASISTELALRHDPDNVPALLIKGFMLRDPDAAYPLYQRALAGDQEHDLALYTYHNDYLVPQLRSAEARDLLLAGLEEDPDSILILQPLAMLESRAGNHDRALELVSQVGKADGSNFLVSSVLGDVYYRMRDAERLKKAAEESIEKIGHQNGFMTQYLIQALVMNNEIEAAQRMIDTGTAWRDEGKSFSATTIGLGLAALGKTREATSWLVQAEREGEFWLRWHLKSALRDFPELAADPAMQQLLQRMGLDDAAIAERKARGH